MNDNSKALKPLLVIIYIAIAVFAVANWLPTILVWFMPFIFAYFVAALTQPLVHFLERKWRFSRKWAGATAWLVSLILMSTVLGFIIAKMVLELIKFVNNTPEYVEAAKTAFTALRENFLAWQGTLPQSMQDFTNTALTELTTRATSGLLSLSTAAGTWIKDFAMEIPGIMLFLLVFIVASFFMCKDYEMLKRQLAIQIPIEKRGRVNQIRGFAAAAVGKYLRGMSIMLSIVFCVLLTGLLILQVSYAFWIAFLLAVLEILPLIGTGIVLIPWGIATIVFAGNLPVGIGLGVLYLANIVIRQLIEPKVMSESLGLYPLVTLLAVYVGLKTYGFVGVVCFPILALICVYLQRAGVWTLWKGEKNEKGDAKNEKTLQK